MICRGCQSEIQSNVHYCPFCGRKILEQSTHSKLWMKGVVGAAILLFLAFFTVAFKDHEMTLAVPGAASGTNQTSIDWLLPIDLQLRAFRTNDIESAYANSVSEEFKKATLLEDFTQYVKRYPILFTHHEVSIKSQSFHDHDNEADITVLLNPEQEATPVRYLLRKENGRWKIWSMNITPAYSESVSKLLNDPSTMRQPVEGQLQALKHREIPKAYHEFISTTFRKTTSLEAFRKFLNAFPVFMEYDAAEFKEPSVDKTTVILEVNLYDKFGTTVLEYTLGIEDNKWKIWGIRIVEQTPQNPTKADQKLERRESKIEEAVPTEEVQKQELSATVMDFSKVEIGTGLNLKGGVVEPSTILKSPHGEIYVNLYILNGIARVKITMYLEHQESHSAMPEVSTTLQQDGNSVLSFSFLPPPQGWPKGHYFIKVTASNGAQKTFTFKIE